MNGADNRMEILLYISAAIFAASLLLIAIFTIIAVRNAKKMMKEVSDTLVRMETNLSGITAKSDQLMERTNRIAADVENKVQSLESVSKSAQHIGNVTENLNKSFSTISRQVATPSPKQIKLMNKLTTLTETVSRIFFSIKAEKLKQESYVQHELKQLPSPQKVD